MVLAMAESVVVDSDGGLDLQEVWTRGCGRADGSEVTSDA
jgi:hypothetical protein